MRFFIALIAAAMPAVAVAQAAPRPADPAPAEVAEMQRQIADPATGAALSRVTGALTRARMHLPVGEMEPAMDGRAATAADKKRTVRDSIGGPEEAARVEREVAASGAQVQVMQKALVAALPGMIAAAGEMEKAMDEARASLPREDDQRR